jgi:quercetin dioxygenase-like cupin family protein
MATIDRAGGSTFERGDDGRFSGEVWLRGTPADEVGTSVAMVHFSPSARTHWHQHPGGQFLVGVTGRGRVRSKEEDSPIFLHPGDVLHVDAGEWHFHGAEPGAPMVHVAVSGGGSPEWGEPVSDEEYRRGV